MKRYLEHCIQARIPHLKVSQRKCKEMRAVRTIKGLEKEIYREEIEKTSVALLGK